MTKCKIAHNIVAKVSNDPKKRYELTKSFYAKNRHISKYGRSELCFLKWEIRRGVLNSNEETNAGSLWWKALNDQLLYDKIEAGMLKKSSEASSLSVKLWFLFIKKPSVKSWYKAHNTSVIYGFLNNEVLALKENPIERSIMNIILIRLIYAHILAVNPKLLSNYFSNSMKILADPRRPFIKLFLNFHKILPEPYPVTKMPFSKLRTAKNNISKIHNASFLFKRADILIKLEAKLLSISEMKNFIKNSDMIYAKPAKALSKKVKYIRN